MVCSVHREGSRQVLWNRSLASTTQHQSTFHGKTVSCSKLQASGTRRNKEFKVIALISKRLRCDWFSIDRTCTKIG